MKIFGLDSTLSLCALNNVRRNCRFENWIIFYFLILSIGNITLLIYKKYVQLEGSIKYRKVVVDQI